MKNKPKFFTICPEDYELATTADLPAIMKSDLLSKMDLFDDAVLSCGHNGETV